MASCIVNPVINLAPFALQTLLFYPLSFLLFILGAQSLRLLNFSLQLILLSLALLILKSFLFLLFIVEALQCLQEGFAPLLV